MVTYWGDVMALCEDDLAHLEDVEVCLKNVMVH